MVRELDTGSQVSTSLRFFTQLPTPFTSKGVLPELVASETETRLHGLVLVIILWCFPSMSMLTTLSGRARQLLYLAISTRDHYKR